MGELLISWEDWPNLKYIEESTIEFKMEKSFIMLPLNSQAQGLIPVTSLILKNWCYTTFRNTKLDSCTD